MIPIGCPRGNRPAARALRLLCRCANIDRSRAFAGRRAELPCESMQLLSEFRNPAHWYSKLIAAALAVSFFTLLAIGVIAAYLVYSIVVIRPTNGDASVNLAIFPGHPEDLSYQVPGVGEREGWFFPGLRFAPTVVLCPGYHA